MRRRSLALVFGTLAALGLAEWLLGGPLRPELVHTRDAAWQAKTRAMHAALHQADPELVYAPRPGAWMQMDYGPAAFNAQGLREPEAVPLEPGPALRLAVLGDSLVWGELLAEADTLPARLDEALGPEVEVLNFGVTGYDTTQEALWYRRRVRGFSPDAALLVFCLNDLLTMSGPLQVYGAPEQLGALEAERAWLERAAPLRNESVSRLWLEERSGDGSQLAAALRHAWRWHRLFTLPGGYVDELLLSGRDPGRLARMKAALAQLGADLEADGVAPFLLISPALYWWHDYQWGALHEAVREAGEEAGFTALDPIEAWAGEDPTALRFPGDNLHYTAEGVRRLVEVTAPWLTQELAPRVPPQRPPPRAPSEEAGASAPPTP